MFHELFPTLVAEGRIFVARPPLFKINLDAKGEKFVYAYDEAERSTVVKKHNRKGEDVSRFKGLGEMPWEHLQVDLFRPGDAQVAAGDGGGHQRGRGDPEPDHGERAGGRRETSELAGGCRFGGLVMSMNGDGLDLFDDQETALPVDPDGTDGGDDGDGGDRNGDVVQFRWDGEQVDYSDAMLDRGRAYGSYVITSRAIPDVRDGLKPVQRRIIVAMDDLGLRSDRKYSKSAKTVGTVIGNYHPHGDTAVYDAMVRMAQPWQSNLPLIDGQGNWGNLNNEAPAAAQRYTESRLAAPASDFLSDLRPEVVDYEWNFDETGQMPSVLPVTFPNLLVNGSMGVAWAMACSIPPHNTAEVLSAALLVLDDPDVSTDKLLKVMPGPDLPGGGIVVNPDNLRAIYQTGRGTVLVQGRFEQLPGQQTLRITELPYQVSAKSIVEQAVQGAKDGKITEIFTAELPKNLTDAAGVDVQVKCKRGGSIDKLTQELLQHTRLRDTLAFNLTVLVEGAPQTLSLRAILQHFVNFRRQVVTRRLEHERDVLLKRLHLLLAERAAADVIDRVVQIIRTADDDDDSKRKLIAELRYVPHGQTAPVPIDDIQAQHIIDMALKKINALNQLKINEELGTKAARVDEITGILLAEGGVNDIVRSELKQTRKQFGQPRRTVIPNSEAVDAMAANATAASNGKLIAIAAAPAEDVWAYIASNGATLLSPQTGKPVASSPLRVAGRSRSHRGGRHPLRPGPAAVFRARPGLSGHPVGSSGVKVGGGPADRAARQGPHRRSLRRTRRPLLPARDCWRSDQTAPGQDRRERPRRRNRLLPCPRR